MDYTHFRWMVRDKDTNKAIRTVVAKNTESALKKLKPNEKLSERIGGARF